MKTPITIALVMLVLMAPAASQESHQGQMMYCDDAGCGWVTDPDPDPSQKLPAAVLVAPNDSSQYSSQNGWPIDPYTGLATPPPGNAQPVVIYGYSALNIPALLDLKPPMPMCAPTPGQALALFSAGVETQDINKVLSAYDWTAIAEAQVDPLISRLGAITAGGWQRRYVEASFDADFTTTTPDKSVRWITSQANPGLVFDLVEKSDCWFVRFSAPNQSPPQSPEFNTSLDQAPPPPEYTAPDQSPQP